MNITELKKRKEELGYTSEKIAELSGVPLSTVQKIFAGITKRPRYDTLLALEKALYMYDSSAAGTLKETQFSYAAKKQGEYTAEDYYALPDNQRAELIDGVIYNMTSPTSIHQSIVLEIGMFLRSFIRNNKGQCYTGIAPYDVKLFNDSSTIVQPDIFIVCDRNKIGRQGINGAPDFIAEVISPSTKKMDMVVKLQKYQEAGVREYWIVDAEDKKIIVYLLEDDLNLRIYSFEDQVPVWIFGDECKVDFKKMCEEMTFLYELAEDGEKI